MYWDSGCILKAAPKIFCRYFGYGMWEKAVKDDFQGTELQRWSCHSLRWGSLAEGADVGQRIKSSTLDMLNLRFSLGLSVKVLSRQLKLKMKSETSTHRSSFQPWN